MSFTRNIEENAKLFYFTQQECVNDIKIDNPLRKSFKLEIV